jgi:hypothetical protein
MQASPTIYQVRCPGCRCILRVSQGQLGKLLRCRHCAKKFTFRGPPRQRVPATSGAPAQMTTGRPVTQLAPTPAAQKASPTPAAVPAPLRAANTTASRRQKAPPAPAAVPTAPQAPPKKPAPPKTAAARPAPRPAPVPPRPIKPPAPPTPLPTVSRPVSPPRPARPASGDEGYSPRQKLLTGGASLAGVVALAWFFFGGSGLASVSGTVKLERFTFVLHKDNDGGTSRGCRFE